MSTRADLGISYKMAGSLGLSQSQQMFWCLIWLVICEYLPPWLICSHGLVKEVVGASRSH